MKKTLLKTGDVVYLENGMKVYGSVPEKFVYSNKKKSNDITRHEVQIGRVLSIDTDISSEIEDLVKDIRHAFDFRLGINLSKADAKEMIGMKVSKPKASTFCFEGGEFLVVETKMDGGGTGMGSHDVYPDGHHVFCKRVNLDGSYNENGEEIDFYQTGSFTSVINIGTITVVRTMTKTTNFA